MESVWIFVVLAVVVEALTEYGKNLLTQKRHTAIVQLVALGISVTLCLLTGTDVLAVAGIALRFPWVGQVITGIFASRGANVASDTLQRILRTKKGTETDE